jgi:phosphoglycerate dehydrogenase-like enzyme
MDLTRVIVATRPGRFREALLTQPPDGAETRALGPLPLERDDQASVVVVGGMAAPLAEILEAMPGVQWIHASSAGVERFLVPAVIARDDVILTNSSGAHEAPMAEFVMAAILGAAKRFPNHVRNQAARRWAGSGERAQQRLVRGATALILGPGRVGREVARLARALDMNVIAVRRGDVDLPEAQETGTPADLVRLATRADYLIVTAALTTQTRGIVSTDVLAALPSHAWVINVSRGPIIDEAALAAALRDNRIGGAVLDTLWTEPLDSDSPWWEMPNVVITGHSASANGSTDNLERTLAAFRDNLARYRRGEPLLNVVDKRAGY